MVTRYLLDTNVLIEMFRGDAAVQRRIAEHGPENCYISEFSIAELKVGYYRTRNMRERSCIDFVLENFHIIKCSSAILDRYAGILAGLQSRGRTACVMDMMIMATALVNDMTVVTNDAHFTFLESLKHEDWKTE